MNFYYKCFVLIIRFRQIIGRAKKGEEYERKKRKSYRETSRRKEKH